MCRIWSIHSVGYRVQVGTEGTEGRCTGPEERQRRVQRVGVRARIGHRGYRVVGQGHGVAQKVDGIRYGECTVQSAGQGGINNNNNNKKGTWVHGTQDRCTGYRCLVGIG